MPHVRNQVLTPADCLVRLGTGTYQLARKDLVLVDHPGTVFPLPWCPACMSGLVYTERGPVPLLDWQGTRHAGDPEPQLLLVLHTTKGLLAVAAHALADLDAAVALPYPDLCQTVTGYAADFQAGAAAARTPPDRPDQTVPSMPFLHVRSGSKEALLHATEVRQVGKHAGAHLLQAGDALHWAVQMDGELLLARSLAASYQAAGPDPSEPWCLYPAGAGYQALLVQEVLGLVQAPVQQVKRLQYDGRSSTWLLRDRQAPLEVLTLGDAAGDAPPATPARPAPAVQSWRTPAQDALELAVGPWKLLLAVQAVQAVRGRAKDLRLSAVRFAHALPVLDLRRLLGATSDRCAQDTDNAVATQVHLGRRPVLLLSDHATAAQEPRAHANAGWYSPPALPQELRALLHAVRLGPDGCALLLQTPIVPGARKGFTRARIQHAFVGWSADPAPATPHHTLPQA